MKNKIVAILVLFIMCSFSLRAQKLQISQEDLRDKISGYWIGQLVGNYMGFPFEGTYLEEAIPVFIDHYYQFDDDASLAINRNDLRGYCPVVTSWFNGAFSDDDTDIEFVTLHAVEKYGLNISYKEITKMWTEHINRNIWCANRTARTLMSRGYHPPLTGSMNYNKDWYTIDPQLVNEIWSMFYPGMIHLSAEKAEWSARITSDSWGTHPTIAYAAMYSAAVFEKDVDKLVALALTYIPGESPFKEGMEDVIHWHSLHPDWRVTRKLIFEKYYQYKTGNFEAPVSDVSALPNGLLGIMAILYGEGDFLKTTGIAVSAGLDCDNQAATCAGLIGVIHGGSRIPEEFTMGLKYKMWNKPFNDTYINFTRDGLPINNSICDLVNRILIIAEKAILQNGGRKFTDGDEIYYEVHSDMEL